MAKVGSTIYLFLGWIFGPPLFKANNVTHGQRPIFQHTTGNLGMLLVSSSLTKDIAKFAVKFPENFIEHMSTQFCVLNSIKSLKLAQGKYLVRQRKNRENTGNLKVAFDWGS